MNNAMLQKILNRMPLLYALAVATLIIAPLLYIARYNHAGADDYEVSRLLLHTQSVWQTAMALMERSAAYTGVFLQAICQPTDVQGVGFRLVPIGIIFTYLLTFFIGSFALLPSGSLKAHVLLSLGCFAVFFRLMDSPMQTLFWSMSAIGYASGYALGVLFIVALAQYLRAGRADGFSAMYTIVIVAALLALGSLPVVALLTVGLCTGAPLYAFLHRRKEQYLPLLALLLLVVIIFALMLNAPGSLRRISESGYQGWTDRPIMRPLYFAFNMYRDYVAKWFSDSLFALSSLAFVGWLAEKRVAPQLRLPVWLPFALTFVFGYLWFAVPKLLVGYIAARQIDTALVFFLTGWSISLVYLAAFLQRRFAVFENSDGMRFVVFAAMLITLLLPPYISNMRFLWVDIRSGAAAQHDAEMKKRYQVMRASTQDTVKLDSLQAMPATIYKGDLEINSSDWLNRSFAGYFGVSAVTVHYSAKSARIP